MLKQRRSSGSPDLNRPRPDHDAGSLWDCSVGELIERLASTKPTPGGGSCAMIVASMGAALLKKAVAVSLQKASPGSGQNNELEALMEQLDRRAPVLSESADRDAAAFEDYLRAVRLPHHDPAEAELRKKAIEAALVDATTMPLAVTNEIEQIVASGLRELTLVHKAIVSDAIVGLRLLIASAACLLTTAEDNVSSLIEAPSFERLNTELHNLRQRIDESEQKLEEHIRGRVKI